MGVFIFHFLGDIFLMRWVINSALLLENHFYSLLLIPTHAQEIYSCPEEVSLVDDR